MSPKRFLSAVGILILLVITASLDTEAQESSSGITRVLNQIASQFPQIEGYVVDLVGGELILDLKRGQAVKPGDRLKLFRYGKKLTHPVTGKSLGRMETDLGEVEILEIRKNFTRAKATNPNIKTRNGDGVRSRFRKISILPGPVESLASRPLDSVTLLSKLEKKINEHPRFSAPSFDLKIWLLEAGLEIDDLKGAQTLKRLRQKVLSDYILLPQIREVKGKQVLGYKLISAIDGTLAKTGNILLEVFPKREKAKQGHQAIIKGKPGIRFKSNESNEVDFVGKQTFNFEIVDFDVGDLNGDGKLEYVVASPNKLFIYSYEGGRFKLIARVSRRKGENKFLSVDVGDINGNKKDEIFVTNKYLDRLGSFVLEYKGKKMKTLWENVDSYFRIIRSVLGKPQLLTQKAGIDRPFSGNIFKVKYQNGEYIEREALKLSDSYNRRMQFMLYGMNRLDFNLDENIETIILDKDYHLRVYSATGELLMKSDEYYGHDPRLMNVGLRNRWEEMGDMPDRVSPVYFKGRLVLREGQGRRFLLVPRNHRLGGQLLERTVIVNNCSLVVFSTSFLNYYTNSLLNFERKH